MLLFSRELEPDEEEEKEEEYEGLRLFVSLSTAKDLVLERVDEEEEEEEEAAIEAEREPDPEPPTSTPSASLKAGEGDGNCSTVCVCVSFKDLTVSLSLLSLLPSSLLFTSLDKSPGLLIPEAFWLSLSFSFPLGLALVDLSLLLLSNASLFVWPNRAIRELFGAATVYLLSHPPISCEEEILWCRRACGMGDCSFSALQERIQRCKKKRKKEVFMDPTQCSG